MKEYRRLFKYKASDCEFKEDLLTIQSYYQSIEDDVPENQQNEYYNILAAIKKRIKQFDLAESLETLSQKDRVFLYHKAIRLSTELLTFAPNPKNLTQLYNCIKNALLILGVEWNDDIHFSDLVRFDNAITNKEKIVYFIHKILISGFHTRESILSIMNLYIKLLNVLHLSEELDVSLPSRKTLHNVSFELQDYKY
jgi:hypothetical protein